MEAGIIRIGFPLIAQDRLLVSLVSRPEEAEAFSLTQGPSVLVEGVGTAGGGHWMEGASGPVQARRQVAFFGDSITEGKLGASFFRRLGERLPGIELSNYGEGGDTVVSLHRRLLELEPQHGIELVVLWIGLNDVLVKMTPAFKVINVLRKKPPAKDLQEFESHYRAIVDILARWARKAVCVSPLFLGEDLRNPWNRQLDGLARIIQEISAGDSAIEYVDIRKAFQPLLSGGEISTYLPRSTWRVFIDLLTLKAEEAVDARSRERGLHFTLDGAHLNSVGADVVAEVFQNILQLA
jgi:lysophospholipase L1-like esterase